MNPLSFTPGRLLSHQIRIRLLNPHLLPTLLQTVRTSLFPNNSLGPARIPPSSPQQVLEIKRKCADVVIDAVPEFVRGVYFGLLPTDDDGGDGDGAARRKEDMRGQIEEILDVFGDAYMNKHFMFSVVDLIVVRLFPELEEVGVGALLEEKIGIE